MAFTVSSGTIQTKQTTHVHTGPAYQAYQILHVGFSLLPLIVGLDKFFDLLAGWDKYLSNAYASLSPFDPVTTMKAVGAVEIIAGFIVAFRPAIGAYIVAVWLLGIIVNLLLLPGYYDVALRDFGLCLGALALGRLSEEYDHRH
ncbi:MAG: hypothetical protein Q8922_04045 [Bacteroidota bacterium]|nr:hypothetical protein [Bacteroidota bacterium]MDP4233466.1 hypothetical protein [Bacteroidota bacterium]MDP4242332.1 hypothetical protein [Bacteroidota bacterium]MDP4287088.1 hypothetical protein [Bacteroidota bacterium]